MKEKEKEFKEQTVAHIKSVDTWVNERTGEKLSAVELLKPVGRNGFMITYLTTIMSLIETLGNRKMMVVKYILGKMDIGSNVLVITVREIAEETGISNKTVIETLQLLENAKIIQRRTGAIMLSPQLLHKGRKPREQALLTRFYEFGNEKNSTKLEEV
jgi:DNA-binding MarR family transcriptional regulator